MNRAHHTVRKMSATCAISRRHHLARTLAAAIMSVVLWFASEVIANENSASGISAGGSGAFRVAEGRRDWQFPRDHGRHPDFRLEWWYYTGILRADDGRRFGFQVTFFRRGLSPTAPRRESAWRTWSLYAAQAALTDLETGRFLHQGRLGRDALGIAGADMDRHRVWLAGWRAEPLPGEPHGTRLTISGGAFALDLQLRATRPPVLHGEKGLDRKGAEFGQASWYYSLTRLATVGEITLDGDRVPVRGTAWMDHEFGTSQLGPDLAGWDWFGLRLDDGSDLMLYRLRRRDGTFDPASGGSWIGPSGDRRPISLGLGSGTVFEPLRWWKSPATGARYPVAWRIVLPGLDLELEVEPLLDAQELAPTPGIPFAYWEGAVSVRGQRAGRPIGGEGYLELTGYGGELGAVFR